MFAKGLSANKKFATLISRLQDGNDIRFITFTADASAEEKQGEESILKYAVPISLATSAKTKIKINEEEMRQLCGALASARALRELVFDNNNMELEDHGIVELGQLIENKQYSFSKLTFPSLVIVQDSTYTAFVNYITRPNIDIIFNELDFKSLYPARSMRNNTNRLNRAELDTAFIKLASHQICRMVHQDVLRQVSLNKKELDLSRIKDLHKRLRADMLAVGFAAEECTSTWASISGAINVQMNTSFELARYQLKEQQQLLEAKAKPKSAASSSSSSGSTSTAATATAAVASKPKRKADEEETVAIDPKAEKKKDGNDEEEKNNAKRQKTRATTAAANNSAAEEESLPFTQSLLLNPPPITSRANSLDLARARSKSKQKTPPRQKPKLVLTPVAGSSSSSAATSAASMISKFNGPLSPVDKKLSSASSSTTKKVSPPDVINVSSGSQPLSYAQERPFP